MEDKIASEYTGKALRVDLTQETLTVESIGNSVRISVHLSIGYLQVFIKKKNPVFIFFCFLFESKSYGSIFYIAIGIHSLSPKDRGQQ